MNASQSTPREPFLDASSFDSMLAFYRDESIPALVTAITTEKIEAEDIGHLKHQLFNDRWRLSLLLYSGGRPLSEIAEVVKIAIASFDEFLDDENSPLTYVDLSIQDYYVESLWLLSLTKLLGLGNTQVQNVANFYATDETNDGADELLESILAKLGCKHFEADGVIHEDPFQYLLDCIKAEPDQRIALMTKFLKRWYKGQKECDWWGSHIRRPGTTILDTGFFGYWAFEAALVTFLWDIDDSTYRDLPHYPKDLADYARQTSLIGINGGSPTRIIGGQTCPRDGLWFTPARVNSRQHFKQGEVMPVVGGDYGATIWQWDERQ